MAKKKKDEEMIIPLNLWYNVDIDQDDNSVVVLANYFIKDGGFDKEALTSARKFEFSKEELDSFQSTLIKSELLSQPGQGFYRPNMAGAVANVLHNRESKLRFDLALTASDIYSSQLPPRIKVGRVNEIFEENQFQKQLLNIAKLVALRKRLMSLDTLSQIKAMEPIIDYYMGTSYYYA